MSTASSAKCPAGCGSEALYRDQLPGLLNQLADRARVASITASSAIEGIVVADASRADRILAGKAKTWQRQWKVAPLRRF